MDQQPLREQVQQHVLSILAVDQTTAFLAALSQSQDGALGLCDKVRKCTAEIPMADAQSAKLDRILDDAIDHIKAHGATEPRLLAGAARCGTSGCHEQIYKTWLPSAHRYSSMDEMFQRVQEAQQDAQ